jgi:hypothetical protein
MNDTAPKSRVPGPESGTGFFPGADTSGEAESRGLGVVKSRRRQVVWYTRRFWLCRVLFEAALRHLWVPRGTVLEPVRSPENSEMARTAHICGVNRPVAKVIVH